MLVWFALDLLGKCAWSAMSVVLGFGFGTWVWFCSVGVGCLFAKPGPSCTILLQ